MAGPAEPINTFRAEGSTEAPIRVSYHNNEHYNAVVDPHFSTFGVGLGFSDLRPGVRVAFCCRDSDSRARQRFAVIPLYRKPTLR